MAGPRQLAQRLAPWLVLLGVAVAVRAEPPHPAEPEPVAGPITGQASLAWSSNMASDSSSGEKARLPRWLRLGAEIRGRLELVTGVEFEQDREEKRYLQRIRLSATLIPNDWFQFHVQIQDARAFASDAASSAGLANTFDIREAYGEIRETESRRWGLRLGRQELSFGDERLIGADCEWCNLGRSFDGARLWFGSSNYRVDCFASSVVEPVNGRWDRPFGGDQLYGVHSSIIASRNSAVLEPYLLWKHASGALGESGSQADLDVYTFGLRAVGSFGSKLGYTFEIARQTGQAAQARISAWAGYWEFSYRFGRPDAGRRLWLAYSRASGDDDPADDRWGTFDDLYPAGYNECGTMEPFAWRNIQDVAAGGECRLSRRWSLAANYHSYWLADTADGLYTNEPAYSVRNPDATNSFIGQAVNFLVTFTVSGNAELYFGYAHLFPGTYLKTSSLASHQNAPFVSWNVQF